MWPWRNWEVAWNMKCSDNQSSIAVVLIHGFGACKEHWRYNQPELGKSAPCFAIDLIGFGDSSQPKARLINEPLGNKNSFAYNFDNWGAQVADFCLEVVQRPVLLVGNSIGGVVALRASQLLKKNCCGVVLVGCATRALDDKRLDEQPAWVRWTRPYLKSMVRQKWLSGNLFRNASSQGVIKRVLQQAYPSGKNINNSLIKILQKPSKRSGAPEAFHGFINLFDDHLAPQLMRNLEVPVDLIWGEKDPWEPVNEAKKWMKSISCIRSLEIISDVGHCPHDEDPEAVNSLLIRIIQQAT